MKTLNIYTKERFKGHDFEKTNTLIRSLFDPKRTVRYTETPRKRIIPKMLTHPIKESPHI
jgi:hypothetical protein